MISPLTIERKKNIDWFIIVAVYLLVFISFIAINSAVSMLDYKDRIIRTQLIAILIGSFFMIIMWFFDYDILDEYSSYIYLFGIFLLIGVLIFGVTDKGSKSWFRLPFFSIQPSEISRIGLIIFISSYLTRYPFVLRDIIGILKISALIFPFFFLMIKQPDFSGILTTIFPIITLFIVGGIELSYFYIFGLYVLIAISVPFFSVFIKLNPEILNNDFIELVYSFTYFNWNMLFFILICLFLVVVFWYIIKKFNPLVQFSTFIFMYLLFISAYITGVFIKDQIKEYQYKRIESFIYPEKDPRGAGYNIIQARVAVGSGGIKGKGIFKGSQTRLGFIPERHTDFIISVIGEEMGFIGISLVIFLYLILLNRFKFIALNSRNLFGYYLSVGFAGLLMGYFFINIGMILGFFPVAGVPLPFVSYGGSNLVASFIIIGIVQSIFKRRLSIA